MKQHRQSRPVVSYRRIDVRSTYDWVGSRGIELSIFNENVTVFGDSFKKALQDLKKRGISHWEEDQVIEFEKSEKLFVIQPSMDKAEKQNIDDSLQKWAAEIS